MRKVDAELRELVSARKKRQRDFDRQKQKLVRERDNVVTAIREGGYNATLSSEFARIEAELTALNHERDEQLRADNTNIDLPSIDTLESRARDIFADLAVVSPDFQRAVRRVALSIEVFPYRPIDGGIPVLRAKVSLILGALIDTQSNLLSAVPSLKRVIVVDLFNVPQRVAICESVVKLRKTLKQREVALQLGVAQAAVGDAMALQRAMDAMGRSNPYIPLREPPADYPKLRRHRHVRYRFEPLSGYETPQFPTE